MVVAVVVTIQMEFYRVFRFTKNWILSDGQTSSAQIAVPHQQNIFSVVGDA